MQQVDLHDATPEEKHAAIRAALAEYDAFNYPGDRYVARMLGVSNHLVKRVRTGLRPGASAADDEDAWYDDHPPPLPGEHAPAPTFSMPGWAWAALACVAVLVLVMGGIAINRPRPAAPPPDVAPTL